MIGTTGITDAAYLGDFTLFDHKIEKLAEPFGITVTSAPESTYISTGTTRSACFSLTTATGLNTLPNNLDSSDWYGNSTIVVSEPQLSGYKIARVLQ